MKKEPGCSSIEVDSIVHEFLVGDRTHPRSRVIYMMLEEMGRNWSWLGMFQIHLKYFMTWKSNGRKEYCVITVRVGHCLWVDQYKSRFHH